MIDSKEFVEELNKISYVDKPHYVETKGGLSYYALNVKLPELKETLRFDLVITECYPYKTSKSESITFLNKSLIEHPHIMENGDLCLHTFFHYDWREKLKMDIAQLKEWVEVYYLGHKADSNYEHLVVNEHLFGNAYYSFNYADVDIPFTVGEHGVVKLHAMHDGYNSTSIVHNYCACNFHEHLSQKIHVAKLSNFYTKEDSCIDAIYLYCKDAPARYNKFAFEYYHEFSNILTQSQIEYLHDVEEAMLDDKRDGQPISIFFGYRLPDNSTNWIVAIMTCGEFPIQGIREYVDGKKTGKWITSFKLNEKILWASSYNISYDLFFGRGKFAPSFTSHRILVIGVGAIGSIVAKTLARCGCRYIDVNDIDYKEPGNVCRSEYTFLNGKTTKSIELQQQLMAISPHVDVNVVTELLSWGIKARTFGKELDKTVYDILNDYDVIFDCTTDDELMYLLEQMRPRGQVINISITNHAHDLVCAFSPSIFSCVNLLFRNVLDNDPIDMFNPTGCWNPTFKASYNDIALMVQYALKRITRMVNGSEHMSNFIISDSEEGLKFRPC